MPIYEYRCTKCRQRTSTFVRSFSPPESVQCGHCGSQETKKMMSSFVSLKSEESRLEELESPASWGDVDEKDPKSMARWMRRMEHAMGQDLGTDFEELAEQVEAGDGPEGLGEEGNEDGEAEDGDFGEDGEFD